MIRSALLCSALLALLVGCDSSADNGGPPLTESESENLVLGMLEVMADDTALEDVEIGFDDLELELSLEWTTPCENGGEVQMAGKIVNFENEVPPSFGSNTVLRAVPMSCGIRAPNGTDFVVVGDPDLEYTIQFEIFGLFEALTLDGSLRGALDWAVGDRNGDCPIDAAFEFAADSLSEDDSAPPIYLEGSACGHDIRVNIGDEDLLPLGEL
ncbi:MAG: hypothetical protein F4065_06530 [Rhodothermaceae bacterium]|nr:hypothetical protein [Rhodothermaceae bacterium]